MPNLAAALSTLMRAAGKVCTSSHTPLMTCALSVSSLYPNEAHSGFAHANENEALILSKEMAIDPEGCKAEVIVIQPYDVVAFSSSNSDAMPGMYNVLDAAEAMGAVESHWSTHGNKILAL